MRKVLVMALVLGASACSEAPEPPPPYAPVGDTKQTMALIVEPAADVIWDSAGVVVTEAGEEDLAPTTDEGWLRVKQSAAMVAEAGNLLMMPERSQGRHDWLQISGGLVEAGKRAMAAAEAQDKDALFESGAALYGVCVSCHTVYWRDGGRFTGE